MAEADVTEVVSVEEPPHRNDVRRASSVKGKVEAHVGDQIIKAFLPVKRGPRHGQGSMPRVFDSECGRAAHILDRGPGDAPETGSVSPSCTPVVEVSVGWCLPPVHPNGHHREKPLIGREFALSFAETRIGDMQ